MSQYHVCYHCLFDTCGGEISTDKISKNTVTYLPVKRVNIVKVMRGSNEKSIKIRKFI